MSEGHFTRYAARGERGEQRNGVEGSEAQEPRWRGEDVRQNLATAEQLLHLLTTYALAVNHLRHLQLLPRCKHNRLHAALVAQAAAEVDDLTLLHLLPPTSAEQESPVPGVTHIQSSNQPADAEIVAPRAS
jgi:hypothetical protein